MRVREAAQRLDVSQATVYALVASGKLRCHRVGLGRGCIRISEEHLAEYLRASEPVIVQGPPPAPVRRAKLKHLHR
jgi:excisionase family DNA binding protein